MDRDLKNKTLPELEKILNDLNEPKYISKVIFAWIHKKDQSDINKFSNISKELRQKFLENDFYASCLKLVKKLEDKDGTLKYLFELSDGKKIESVLLTDKERKTICLSSQVGCKWGCAFCVTGKMNFIRNLTAAEIVDQVSQIEKNIGEKINNLVYMGMGEPLDNYDNVLKSIRILNDPQGKNIGARHISISTCGIIPGIIQLAKEPMQLRLAVSLHANTDNLRGQIMKVNHKYPLDELVKALRDYQQKTKRRITFEYLMLDGVNDTRQHARGILNLLNGIQCHINLIEFNDYPGSTYKASPKKTIKEFAWIIADRGFEVTIRYKKGREINAACGQLGARTNLPADVRDAEDR